MISIDFIPSHYGVAKLVPISDSGMSQGHLNVSGLMNQHMIYTYNGYQYIIFITFIGHVQMKRRLSGGFWGDMSLVSIEAPVPTDSHNGPAFGFDPDGYIHVCYNVHTNPLKYRRSTNPEDITIWGAEIPMTGVNEAVVTYPTFLTNPINGKLFFMYRDGVSGNGDLFFNSYDEATTTWTSVKLIDGKATNVNPYQWKPKFDKNGVLHLFWNWRDTPINDTNHDICYAKWDGVNWKKSDGSNYALPITTATAEVVKAVAAGQGLGELFSCDTDHLNHPHAVYWMLDGKPADRHTSIYHIYFNGAAWVDSEIERTEYLSLQGFPGNAIFPVARPEILCDRDTGETFIIYRSLAEGNGVSVLRSTNYSVWDKVPILKTDLLAWSPAYDRSLWLNEKKIHLYIEAAAEHPAQIMYIGGVAYGRGYTWAPPVRGLISVLELDSRRLPLAPLVSTIPEMKTILSFQLTHNPNVVAVAWGTAIDGSWFSLKNDLLPPGTRLIYARFIGELRNDTPAQTTSVGIRHAGSLDGSAINTDFPLATGNPAGGAEVIDSGWVELNTIGPYRTYLGGSFFVEGMVTGGIGNVVYGTILIGAS
jgi:hypothetical protein